MTIKKQKLTNILFYFSYFLVVSSEMLTQVKYIASYLKYFDYLAILILFVVFLIQSKNYSLKSFIYSIIFIFLSVVVTYVSKDSNILKLVLFLIYKRWRKPPLSFYILSCLKILQYFLSFL